MIKKMTKKKQINRVFRPARKLRLGVNKSILHKHKNKIYYSFKIEQ